MDYIKFLAILGNVNDKKNVKVIPGGRKGTESRHIGHTTHVLALALSTDAMFLVRLLIQFLYAILISFILQCKCFSYLVLFSVQYNQFETSI